MRIIKHFLLSLIALLLLPCCDDTEYEYASLRAYFHFSPVTAAPKTLYPALTSPGQWCSVSVNATSFIFKAMDGQTDMYPINAVDQYHSRIWVSGLLIGTPSILPIGSTDFAPICYDLVCPNCRENDAVTRALRLGEAGTDYAECTRCQRRYGLNEQGMVTAGAVEHERNISLYRYRCSYANNTFVVQN